MKFELLQHEELDATLLATWSRIQRASPLLRSPFFRPEFTQLCARLQGNVEIAVLEEHGEVIGFFPFQRVGRQHAIAIGKGVSDFQGVLVKPDCHWSLSHLMRACRLKSWEFDHLVSPSNELSPYVVMQAQSPYAEMHGGFQAYREAKRKLGSKGVESTMRSLRSLVRDHGPIDFRLEDREPDALSQMLRWQRENLMRRGTLFLGQEALREALLRELLDQSAPEFQSCFGTVRCGGQLLAGSFFLRSHETMHWWVSSYDAAWSKYAPGALSVLLSMQEASQRGVTRIDFGRGTQELKLRLMTGSESVAEGVVEVRPVVRMVRHAWRHVTNWVWNSPLKSAAKESLARWRRSRVQPVSAH